MFNVNTSTKLITNDKTFAIDNIKNLQKITFALFDNDGNPVFSENNSFRITITGLFTDYEVTAIDDNKVSFRSMNFTGKLSSSSTEKAIKVQKFVAGSYVDVVDDTITITADIGGVGTESDPIYTADKPDIAFKDEVYTKSEVYTKTQIENKGYLTQHQDISGKANVADVYAKTDTYNKTEIDAKFSGIDTVLDNINGEVI